MANFNDAFDKVIKHEGGYSNNPHDKGGETFMGVCRKFYPNLKIWKTIDEIKKKYVDKNAIRVINNLKNTPEHLTEIKNVYKTNYWNKLYLDEIYSQRIAETLFDDAVNRGTVAAIKTAQKILKLKISGKMSKELRETLKTYGVKQK